MNLDERLQKARNNGYIPVHDKFSRSYFFIKDDRDFKVGDIIEDALGFGYKVVKVSNGELEAE